MLAIASDQMLVYVHLVSRSCVMPGCMPRDHAAEEDRRAAGSWYANSSVGIRRRPHRLSADSGPSTPRTSPLPNCDLSLAYLHGVAVGDPVVNRSAQARITPIRQPIPEQRSIMPPLAEGIGECPPASRAPSVATLAMRRYCAQQSMISAIAKMPSADHHHRHAVHQVYRRLASCAHVAGGRRAPTRAERAGRARRPAGPWRSSSPTARRPSPGPAPSA